MAEITYNKTVQLPQKLRFHLTQNTWDLMERNICLEIVKISNYNLKYLVSQLLKEEYHNYLLKIIFEGGVSATYECCKIFTDIMSGKRSSGKVVLTLVGLKVQ